MSSQQQANNEYTFPFGKLTFSSTLNNVVLIACGSFNPITNSHLRMFETARDFLQNEEGYHVVGGFISPVHQDYEKRKPTLISAKYRVDMCRLAVSDSDWINIDEWEVNQSEYSRTLLVLKHFQDEIEKSYTSTTELRIMLLCGADLLQSFVKPGVWIPEQVEYILSKFGACCIERDGISVNTIVFEHDTLYRNKKNIHIIPEWIINDVSSTKVRQLVRRNNSVKYYVHDKVEKYINEHKLYKAEDFVPIISESVFENKKL
ncbi:predicted protein [Naegleria gruberi]|uniref:Nicotinamide-nucleotide adenylyltransferase n=1 Tax=Naegleria gruberi TaxID=5762 RepID=D2UZN7_NAEGR|nr:uncharacterized protein NAEGRDRAFT_29800 [Naegleria gruberi]EFC50192.1 predicted protein [Naegleria gruberi]|eukprot:XP_002682936.1 predicted protein [Naegleria gruberi strain NEG-M]